MRRAFARSAALLVLAVGCTGDGRSPVGADLLPGGVLGGGLQVVTLQGVERAEEYAVFPAGRGLADRLVTAQAWPSEPGFESRALVRFLVADLDSLVDSEVVSASVRLVFSPPPAAPISFRLHRVTSEWNEVAATWDRRDLNVAWAVPGGDFDPAPLAEFTIEPADSDSAVADSVQVPIPESVVADWISGAAPNAGLVLIQVTPGVALDFISRNGGGGLNPLAPRLDVEVQLPGPGNPAFLEQILAGEDTFIATDRGSFAPGGLVVSAGAPVRRVFLVPLLEGVPEGATVATAKLILSVDEVRIPGDSLRLIANEVLSEFLGEKTILAPQGSILSPLANTLGLAVVSAASPPDSVVFESARLTRLVRGWLLRPETNRGIVLTVLDEETAFGGVGLFGPAALAGLAPRLRLVVIPPPIPAGPGAAP